MKYRADIDGLRAIAVIAVVAVHVGFPGWRGGFVGVDVFFVISGFLISTLLLDEHTRTGTISFVGFYARRMRRILPALAVVLAATILAAALLLNPVEQQKSVMQSATASALFGANIFFWRTTGGYFDNAAESLPLLHMWSLGVEEQWYLVFPALLLGLLEVLRRFVKAENRGPRLLVIIATLAVLSYGLCIVGTEHRARAAFFLLPTRAWEFLFGVCVGLWLRHKPQPGFSLSQMLSLLGFAVIILSIVLMKEGQHFPGYVAAAPVLATCALIIAGSQPLSLAHRVLSVPPLRWFGQISYSWYLWHWPVLVFARTFGDGEKNLVVDILSGGVISLGLAVLTYRYVEQPTRRSPGGASADRRSVLAGVTLTAAVAALSVAGWIYSVHMEKQPSYRAFIEAQTGGETATRIDYRKCMGRYLLQIPKQFDTKDCLFGDASSRVPSVLLWGDSHAGTFTRALDAIAKESRVSVLLRSRGACAPLDGVLLMTRSGDRDSLCQDFGLAVTNEIETSGVKAVVLMARWPQYMADRITAFPAEKTLFLSPVGEPLTRKEALAFIQDRLDALAEQLGKRGIRLLLVSPLSDFPQSVPQCLAKRGSQGCDVSRAKADAFTADHRAIFASLAARHANVRVWEPLRLLCNESVCPTMREGVVLYRDNNHLSHKGVLSLKDDFQRAVWPWLLEGTSSAVAQLPHAPAAEATR